MDYQERWDTIGVLGEGGQGKVYRVLDKSKFDILHDLYPSLRDSLAQIRGGASSKEQKIEFYESFRETVFNIIRMDDPVNHSALKVLHEPKEARDSERGQARIKNEIQAMSEISHPNLLRILERDPDSKWFVSQFHHRGTLIDNKKRFTGNFIESLRAFKPLVEGVAELHRNRWVHRDIKPENVFLDSDDNLVLGDFGLIYFTDPQHTRLSGKWENVGSRDWMPGWTMGMIEDIKPTFDVFCLGKLLWAMVSNKPILRLWYFHKDDFNLESMFPDAPYINLANRLFEKCIVEDEEHCLPDATALLEGVDELLSIINKNADFIGDDIERTCRVCGTGHYSLAVDRDLYKIQGFGFNASSGGISYKLFKCTNCGHVQLFAFDPEQEPPAWTPKK